MFGAINYVIITKNHFTKQNSLACFLAKGTRQWQQHYKENLLVELCLKELQRLLQKRLFQGNIL